MILTFITVLISLTSFSNPVHSQQSGGHHITFYKIDNRVKLFLAEELVYDTELVDGNPNMSLDVNLEKYLKKGLNSLRVELYNGSEMNDFISDTNWEIRYEIFNNGESIDYLHQLSKKGTEGLVFEYKHDIFKK